MGSKQRLRHIPSSTEEITQYIADNCPRLSIITLRRHVSALVNIHMALELPENPAQHPLVSKTLKGAARTHGAVQRAVKPLLIEDLRRILDLEGKTVADCRNKALLVMGFAGSSRRSELVALNRHDIEERSEGLVINITKSKTDQEMMGRTIGIPYGRGSHCPVRLHLEWMELCGPIQDAVFRGCAKGGHITDKRLSNEAVAKIVKASVSRIGLNPDKYSGHSLRAGFVTSAVAAGARTDLIRKQTGHASDQTMARYIRDGDMFRQNAVSLLFLKAHQLPNPKQRIICKYYPKRCFVPHARRRLGRFYSNLLLLQYPHDAIVRKYSVIQTLSFVP